MNFLKKQVPFFYTLIFAFSGAIISFFLIRKYTTNESLASQATDPAASTVKNCNYTISRLKGYEYIKPLVNEEAECEAPALFSLKQQITDLINIQKQSGAIIEASVYFKMLSTEEWITINPKETYLPGSLFKLPILLSILKMAETNPALLNKQILYSQKDVIDVQQTYATRTLEAGKVYTVKELLTYMIAYSDNAATQLLNHNLDPKLLNKIFVDLGLKPLVADNAQYLTYTITPKDYSIFMEALYNGSYLTIDASEYATSLLAKCNFKDGLLKDLPSSIKIAHKFGEAGTPQIRELHETGIIYIGNSAYLITIMTRGSDLNKLSQTISHISKIAYDRMKENS